MESRQGENVVFRCDVCGNRAISVCGALTITQAWAEARALGWDWFEEEGDVCPTCLGKEKS